MTNGWLNIAGVFETHWQLPNGIGALDGKHVLIQSPTHAGSEFYNYENNHSIVLLAVYDAEYKCVVVDIGAKGKQSDRGILRNSVFGQMLFNNNLDTHADRPIEYASEEIEYNSTILYSGS